MDYFKLLDFKIEPFSNAPDPRLFYHSRQHLEVLQKLEISIRLKRGLNVVVGDIGTGKTTVSRQLIQKISHDKAIGYYLILDPGFSCVHGLLTHILQLLTGKKPKDNLDENHLKEQIKTLLFTRGVDENINTVLVIDEGQKLSLENLEVLRELLNFETNDQKLLQIVIFAQNEFDEALDKVKNFQDRINFRYNLTALNFKESKGLIQYRLNQSFVKGKQRPVFSWPAFIAIYGATKGSPRKIVNLCHQVILSLIIKNKKKAGVSLIRSCAKNYAPSKKTKLPLGLMANIILAGVILAGGYYYNHFIWKSQAPPLELYPVSRQMPGTDTLFDPKTPAKKTPPPVPSVLIPPQRTVPRKTAEVSHEAPPSPLNQTPSDLYGSILVPANATIYRMINIVYGDFSQELLNEVMAHNNVISAPDRLLSGIPLHFPAPGKKKEYPDHMVFLLLLQTRDFNRAFTEAASAVYKDLDVRILPFQGLDKRYLFNVIIDRPFEDRKTALAFQEKIQSGIPAIPKNVVSLKPNDLTDKG